jgi:nitroreductase
MTIQNFDKIIQKRRSVRIYDKTVPFDESAIERSVDRAILSPNSSNMQLWEFYWVKTKSVHDALTHACMGQSAMKTANQAVVFVTRQDKWKERSEWNLANLKKQFEGKILTKRDERALDYYRKLMPLVYRSDSFGFNTLLRTIIVFFMGFRKPFLRIRNNGDQRVITHKSCALAAQTFMLSMAAEGYDTCPMEGFDQGMVKKILNLPPIAEITMIVACGTAKPEGIYLERTRVPNEEVFFEV